MVSIAGRRFLKPIKASLDAIIPCISSSSHSAYPCYGRCRTLKTLVKDLEPVLHKHASRFHEKLNIQRTHMRNFYYRAMQQESGDSFTMLEIIEGLGFLFCLFGEAMEIRVTLTLYFCMHMSSKLSMGSIFGFGAAFGSINILPHFAHAMDGDYHVDPLGVSGLEEGPHTFWMLVKKFWVPLLLFTIVLVNWEHPFKLVVNAIFFIFTTKPRPFSVYLAIEQLRHQSMRQQPYFYKFKPLYAKKVEVKDYNLFCIAKVELRDEEFNLVGILGSWWILPPLPSIPQLLGIKQLKSLRNPVTQW